MVAGEGTNVEFAVVAANLRALWDGTVREGAAAHEVEAHLFRSVLELGGRLLRAFFEQQGDGDLGETFVLPDGRTVRRLPGPHVRRYVSVFGELLLSRAVYGRREGQAIEFVPFDQRLSLPESDFSYLVQEWDQLLGIEHAFGRVLDVMRTILGLRQTVDGLERTNRRMAEAVEPFRESLPAPRPEEEGELLVAIVDNKGIPMVRPADAPPPGAHRTKGEKANKKQMAALGCVYSVDPHVRTPEALVAALFRDDDRPRTPPPKAQQRRYWASLTRVEQGETVRAQPEVFRKMADDVALRRRPGQTLVVLSDGQRSLETDRRLHLPEDERAVDVLDLMHVLPRLWQAAHLFHKEGSREAEQFVRQRLLQVLQGRTARVVAGLRRMGTVRGLAGPKKKRLRTACDYLAANRHRMRYDEYLAKGYPVATGVIEGACRHVVKDRMERAGMRWKIPGAQAMLQLRTVAANDHWREFQDFRIRHETTRLYPHPTALQNHPPTGRRKAEDRSPVPLPPRAGPCAATRRGAAVAGDGAAAARRPGGGRGTAAARRGGPSGGRAHRGAAVAGRFGPLTVAPTAVPAPSESGRLGDSAGLSGRRRSGSVDERLILRRRPGGIRRFGNVAERFRVLSGKDRRRNTVLGACSLDRARMPLRRPRSSPGNPGSDAQPSSPEATMEALSGRSWKRLLQHLPWPLLLAAAFVQSCVPMADLDIYWHLRSGATILERGSIERVNEYMYTSAGREWINLHWGFQVAAFLLHRAGGVAALIATQAVLFVSAIAIAGFATGPRMPGWARSVAWVLPVLCIASRPWVRPEMLSLLFMSVYVAVLLRAERRPRTLYWLPLLQLIWINCHSLAVLGTILLALAGPEWLLRSRRGGTTLWGDPLPRSIRRAWIAAMIGNAVAAVCNPYGLAGIMYPVVLLRKFTSEHEFYRRRVSDFLPLPDLVSRVGWSDVYVAAELLLAAATAFSFVALWGIRRRVSLTRVLWFAAFAWLAWRGWRNINLFGLVAGAAFCANLQELSLHVIDRRSRGPEHQVPPGRGGREARWLPLVAALSFSAWIATVVTDEWASAIGQPVRTFGFGEAVDRYPHRAAEFAGQPGYPAGAFVSEFGMSSVYLWHNGPERRTFLDNHLEVASLRTFEEYFEVLDRIEQGRIDWEELIRMPDGRLPLLFFTAGERRRNLVKQLLESPRWRLVYADRTAALFLDAETADRLAARP